MVSSIHVLGSHQLGGADRFFIRVDRAKPGVRREVRLGDGERVRRDHAILRRHARHDPLDERVDGRHTPDDCGIHRALMRRRIDQRNDVLRANQNDPHYGSRMASRMRLSAHQRCPDAR